MEYNLLNAPFTRTFAPKFLKLLNTSLSPCNDPPFTGSTRNVRDLLSKHPGFLWLPIDKNTRKAARLCPKRLFNEIKTFFLKDTVTYSIISDNNEDEEQFVKTILKKLKKEWLKYSWNSKPKKLPYLYLVVKSDGVRFRPIGSYAPCPYKYLLSKASTALYCLLLFTGAKHFNVSKITEVKEQVRIFAENAKLQNLNIHSDTFDIKDFFTAVQKKFMLQRLQFFKTLFIKRNGTDIISVPKSIYKDKNLKPHPGADLTHKYINFTLDTLIEIVIFALDNAFFKLGHYIIQQIAGLTMGDPLSPPLAILNVCYDEHAFKLPYQIPNSLVLIIRYVDDILRFIACLPNNEIFINYVDFAIKYLLYEHDLPVKSLSVIQDFNESTKFLDADVIISKNKKQVKLVFHNKNSDIMKTLSQDIGRFFHAFDCTHIQTKIAAFANILVRAFDATTFPIDCIPAIIELMSEVFTLQYTFFDMHSALIKANRIRKNPMWKKAHNLVSFIFTKMDVTSRKYIS